MSGPIPFAAVAKAILATWMLCTFAGLALAQGGCALDIRQGTAACGRLGLITTYIDITNNCSCDIMNIIVRSTIGVDTITSLHPRATKRVNVKICESVEGYFESVSGTLTCAGQPPARVTRAGTPTNPKSGSGDASSQPSVDDLLEEFSQNQDTGPQTKEKLDAIASAAKAAADANSKEQKAASERAEDAELRKRREAVRRAEELDRQRRAAIARQRPPPSEPIIGSNPYGAPAPVGYCTMPGYLQCAASRCPGNPAACAARCACE